MSVRKIVLFGKHPAWSDHMFVSDGAASSHRLKRVFYDHSVIPALQVGDGDKRISEDWSFLIIIDEQPFFVANTVSRDSVGRRRFPLIAAYPLPQQIKLEASLDKLRELKQELSSLLSRMLESESEDLDQWQEKVRREIESFQSSVDWSSEGSNDVRCELKQEKVLGLMSRLADDYDSLDLKSCSFTEACSFLKLGLKQFKGAPPAMLVLDGEDQGTGLLFSMDDGTGFHLKHHLYGKLISLSVSAGNVPQKVSRLLKSDEESGEDLLLVDEVPSLKLGVHSSSGSRKLIILTVAFALIISVSFGLFYSCGSESCPDSTDSSELESTQQLSVIEKWTLNASAYVEWVQPLVAFADKQSKPIPGFESVAAALESDLNPFVVVEAEKASIKLAKNPPEGFFEPENNANLSGVYANIEKLKLSLATYYEEQFSEKLLKDLKRQNYDQPKFIKVDFSQQPVVPDFGPGLIQQFERYLTNQAALNVVVDKTKLLWNEIIKPFHELCPEHAKFIQHCAQKVIIESGSLNQFEEKYAELLEVFGYPEFIKLDEIDISLLHENPKWVNLPGKEENLGSLRELVELLKENRKDRPQYSPPDLIEQNLEAPELPSIDQVLESADDLTESMPENPIVSVQTEKVQATAITKASTALETTDQVSESSEIVRAAFDKTTEELGISDPQGLLKLYKNLSVHLPQSLQTSKDKGFQQIATYWSRHNTSPKLAKPTKEEIEQLSELADLPVVKEFYAFLLDNYESTNLQMSGTSLEKIEGNSTVESVTLQDDRSRLEIEFVDGSRKLAFLPLETDKGTVFVQQAPLSLQQYVELSNICNFDTEYHLTLQDSFWPRSFEVGMGAGFSALEEWQFRNQDAFLPINAFNRKTLPAHINEPATVQRMAEFFGFRLLNLQECIILVRLASELPSTRLEFSDTDQENLQNSNTVQFSVYSELIAELIEYGKWSGGIDFERGALSGNNFFDIAGGSAELAYDGNEFYALGGSWLYEPEVLEKPVRILNPQNLYSDLGARFVVDAPVQSYGELVEKAALQVITDHQ